MVVTIVWMHNWISLILAVVSLFIVILFLFFCTCLEKKKEPTHFYIIDEKGIRRDNVKNELVGASPCNLNLFRRFSLTSEPEHIFTSKNLPFYSINNETGHSSKDLVDSMETTKSFDNLVLQFDGSDLPLTYRDELRSCAHPSTITRGTSRESFCSLISE
ncbi:uncharacterized protein LOC114341935 isoform X2 [Diabrotica virgifera virgifera]|uniref:Uncharacterized protein LOC114341935 isoform X2 n=1 Tax=Diabrotica virgifera virgifera TaxID=50390 RepID=A0A6P7GR67_DIAVI|nr:uncharacterized protein LOC114341935 isoform X2 [Diabrotica virgifera virgifera]